MREMWMMAPVLFPVVSGGALWIWNPGKNKIHTAAAVLSLAEAVCSWLVILNCMGMELPLWSIGPGMELCLRMDGTGALFSGLASLIWVLVVFFAFEYMEHEKEDARFFGCLIMSLGALTGVAWAGNFVTLYLFFEMMTFFSVPLVFHSRMREALRAGMVYLAYSMLGASIALGGYFFFRQYACGTDFKAGGVLTEAAGMVQGRPQILLLAVFCMAAGFSCKAGLMPLHPWLPIAHPVAPAPASAVLSGLITKAGVVAVIRVVYNMAGPAFLRGTWVQYALLSMAVVTIFTGSMLAYKEKKLKRRLACSSFSQVSYVLFGLMLLTPDGVQASLLQMVFHALAKDTLFLAAGAIIFSTNCTRVDQLRGIGRRMPVTMWCFTLAALSLIGIPPMAGFVSKWYLLTASLEAPIQAFGVAGLVVLVVSALLTAGYLLPVVTEGFFPGRDFITERREVGVQMTWPMIAFAAAVVLMGLLPGGLLHWLGLLAARLFP